MTVDFRKHLRRENNLKRSSVGQLHLIKFHSLKETLPQDFYYNSSWLSSVTVVHLPVTPNETKCREKDVERGGPRG